MKQAQMHPSRLDLPTVARTRLAQINGRSARREPWAAEANGMRIAIRSDSPHAHWQSVDAWAELDVLVDQALVHVHIPQHVIDGQLKNIDAGLDIQSIERDIGGMLMEMLFEPLVNVIEQHAGLRVECQNLKLSGTRPGDNAIGLMLDIGPVEDVPVIVTAPPALHKRLQDWLEDLPINQAEVDSFVMPVCFRAGYAVLTLDELINVRPGDGIIMDANSVMQKSVIAVTGEKFALACNVTANGLECSGALLTPVSGNLKGWTFMSDEEGGPSGESKAEPGAVGQISVRLVFEVGRLDLTVEELQSVGDGHVFDLGRPIGQAVDIIAGGRQIGAGELVRIGDQIGVRVDWILK
jgi:type III secretion protein Q